MDQKDIELYQGYTMQNLYKQVIENTRVNRYELRGTITKLAELMKTIVDVQMISPEIASYMNILVKNEQMMVKIANIAAKVNYVQYRNSNNQSDELSQADKSKAMQQAGAQLSSILYELRNNTNIKKHA